MMNKKSLVLLIFGIFIIIFIVPQIIHFLVYIPSPFGFIKPGEESQWIGFFGSIIGGLLTLAGVWWTIKDQDEKRKEDLAIQYKPYISILPLSSLKYDIDINNIINYDNLYYYFTFFYKNNGKGESFKTTMNIEYNGNIINLSDISEVQIYPDNIVHNFRFKLKKEELTFTKNSAVTFNVSFNYTDMFSMYKYSMCYQLIYVIEYDICKDMYVLISHGQCKTLKNKK